MSANVRFIAAAASQRRERAPAPAAVTALLVLGFVGTAVLAITVGRGSWTEAPLVAGSWAMELGPEVMPGVEAVEDQIVAMQRIAAATASLVALLALVSLTGLLRQRSRLRRPADRIHWSVGASRRAFAARWVGEGWRTGAVAGSVSLGAGLALPAVLASTFPGTAEAPPSIFWTTLLLVLLGSVLLHRSTDAGIRAARRSDGGLSALFSLPGVVVAPALACLVLVGLLRADRGGPMGPDTVDGTDLMAVALLGTLPAQSRGEALGEWVGGLRGAVGVASTGTVRGAGRRASVTVDCGQCSVGGLPLPVRTVQAEVHALAPDTFTHLGVALVAGRDFRADDAGRAVTAAIISHSMAIRHFENGQAVGRRVRFGEGGWIEVVGVVEDRWDTRDPDEFALYLPLLQARPDAVEFFESRGQGGLTRALSEAPSGARVEEPRPVLASFAAGRWFGTVLTILAILALGVAVSGTWMGARAEMRRRIGELVLRRAVGARPWHLWRYGAAVVARHFGGAVLVGAWLTVALAAELERSFGMPPILDARIWIAAALPLLGAFLAGALPPFLMARRAVPASRLEGEI